MIVFKDNLVPVVTVLTHTELAERRTIEARLSTASTGTHPHAASWAPARDGLKKVFGNSVATHRDESFKIPIHSMTLWFVLRKWKYAASVVG